MLSVPWSKPVPRRRQGQWRWQPRGSCAGAVGLVAVAVCGLALTPVTPIAWVWANRGAGALGRSCGASVVPRHAEAVRDDDDGDAGGGRLKGPAGLPLPRGPLCPFQSEFFETSAMTDYADNLAGKQQRIMFLMNKFETSVQSGQRMDGEEGLELARELRAANEMWLSSNFRMRNSEDFQALEFYKMTEAKMIREGLSMEMLEALMKWQPDMMDALFAGRSPPPPPPGLDQAKMQAVGTKMSSLLGSASTPPPRTTPFSIEAMESDVVRAELEKLTHDHENLIGFGQGYRGFDPLGKQAFLEQIALIEDRWKVFMGRFQLLGALNPEFVRESEAFLRSGGLTVDNFNDLMDDTHRLMREDADREGLLR
mmetsp:Transcript_8584/g.26000  ORF Transcript_8584/g.26000 Transcript_8584/m.26000 type:complete len:368 (+) Transcript_8584:47-1150(+)